MDTIEQYRIIPRYNLASPADLGLLAEEVNVALNEGWQPYGAPFFHIDNACSASCY
jgi:hypothetical protein